jgi:hypothetical protein
MTASISAPNWKIRTAAKVMHTKHIQTVLRRARQISQRATEVVFSGTNRRFFFRELGFFGAHARRLAAFSVPRRLPAPQELSRPAREAGNFWAEGLQRA